MKKKLICMLGVLLLVGMMNVLANAAVSVQTPNEYTEFSDCHDSHDTHDHHGCRQYRGCILKGASLLRIF